MYLCSRSEYWYGEEEAFDGGVGEEREGVSGVSVGPERGVVSGDLDVVLDPLDHRVGVFGGGRRRVVCRRLVGGVVCRHCGQKYGKDGTFAAIGPKNNTNFGIFQGGLTPHLPLLWKIIKNCFQLFGNVIYRF